MVNLSRWEHELPQLIELSKEGGTDGVKNAKDILRYIRYCLRTNKPLSPVAADYLATGIDRTLQSERPNKQMGTIFGLSPGKGRPIKNTDRDAEIFQIMAHQVSQGLTLEKSAAIAAEKLKIDEDVARKVYTKQKRFQKELEAFAEKYQLNDENYKGEPIEND